MVFVFDDKSSLLTVSSRTKSHAFNKALGNIFPSLSQAVIWKGIAADLKTMLIGQGLSLIDVYGIHPGANGDRRPGLVQRSLPKILEDHKLRLSEEDHPLLQLCKYFLPSFALISYTKYHFSP